MDKTYELSNEIRIRFKAMLNFLISDDYYIATHDGGFNYILTKKVRVLKTQIDCIDYTWLELCTTIVPKKLGMNFLIIPVDDNHFNIMEYLLDYYNKKREEFIDEIVENPYSMDGRY